MDYFQNSKRMSIKCGFVASIVEVIGKLAICKLFLLQCNIFAPMVFSMICFSLAVYGYHVKKPKFVASYIFLLVSSVVLTPVRLAWLTNIVNDYLTESEQNELWVSLILFTLDMVAVLYVLNQVNFIVALVCFCVVDCEKTVDTGDWRYLSSKKQSDVTQPDAAIRNVTQADAAIHNKRFISELHVNVV